MRIKDLKSIRLAVLAGTASVFFGCAVPQPPGKGKLSQMREPTTNTEWWLYVPDGYPKDDTGGTTGKRWPLVITFHGLNPYDAAHPQARSWQQEADRYGFIVVAPKLRTCNPLMQYPVRDVHPDVAKDEDAVMRIMDDVFRRTDADPTRVLSTSWSAGGYFAHYIVNRHPERFSCLSMYQSNFSAAILDPRTTTRYRDMPIGIFLTENDFNESTKGSEAAVDWYRRNGFTNVRFGRFKGLGHERTPEVPAWVFADACDVTPKSPPPLARLQIMEDRQIVPRRVPLVPGPPGSEALASNSGSSSGSSTKRDLLFPEWEDNGPPRSAMASAVRSSSDPGETVSHTKAAPPLKRTQVATIKPGPGGSDSPTPSGPVRTISPAREKSTASMPPPTNHTIRSVPVPPRSSSPTPRRKAAPAVPAIATGISATKASVRLSTSIGISPLLVSFTADIPEEARKGADFLWTDNGIPICNEINGQKILMEPGRHRIEVLVITKDNQEMRASSDVTVFERLTKKPLAKQE